MSLFQNYIPLYYIYCLSQNHKNGKEPLPMPVTSCFNKTSQAQEEAFCSKTGLYMCTDCNTEIETFSWRLWIKNIWCLNTGGYVNAIYGKVKRCRSVFLPVGHIWAIRGCAAQQGMVFASLSLEQLSVWNRVYFLPFWLWSMVGVTFLLSESCYKRTLLLFPLGYHCMLTQTCVSNSKVNRISHFSVWNSNRFQNSWHTLQNFGIFLMNFVLQLKNIPFAKFPPAPPINVDHSYWHHRHFVSGQHCAGGRGGCLTYDWNTRKFSKNGQVCHHFCNRLRVSIFTILSGTG